MGKMPVSFEEDPEKGAPTLDNNREEKVVDMALKESVVEDAFDRGVPSAMGSRTGTADMDRRIPRTRIACRVQPSAKRCAKPRLLQIISFPMY